MKVLVYFQFLCRLQYDKTLKPLSKKKRQQKQGPRELTKLSWCTSTREKFIIYTEDVSPDNNYKVINAKNSRQAVNAGIVFCSENQSPGNSQGTKNY
jgi:hypothetical protein